MNIFVFGDSTVQGAFDDECGGWVSRLTAHCFKINVETNYDIEPFVFNLGISGGTSQTLLERLESELLARIDGSKTVVCIATGKNDSATKGDTGVTQVETNDFKNNLNTLIDIVERHDAQPVLIGIGRVDESKTNPFWDTGVSYHNSDLEQYDGIITAVARERKILHIPVADFFTSGAHLADGLHANAGGHQLIFERVKEALKKENII
jgi:lysophospholipase L1-like esterase